MRFVLFLLAASFFAFAPQRVTCLGVTFTALDFTDTMFDVVEGQQPALTLFYTASVPISVEECTGVQLTFVADTATAADLTEAEPIPPIEVCVPGGNPASGNVTVLYHQVVDNLIPDGERSFQLFLIPNSISSTTASADINIVDNDQDPIVNLQQDSYQVGENAAFLQVCAELSNVLTGTTSFPIEVIFTFADGTATGSGSDFNFDMNNVTFPAQNTNGDTACLNVTILDDDSLEGLEVLFVELTSVMDASGAGNSVFLGQSTTGSVNITDNEAVTVTLLQPSVSPIVIDENGTIAVTIEASITGALSIERQLNVTVFTDDSVDPLTTLNIDYSVPSNFQFVFSGPSFTAQATGLTANQDLSIEGDHSFTIGLQSVQNAELADLVTLATSVIDVTIEDDDVSRLHYSLSASTGSISESGTPFEFCAFVASLDVGATLDTDLTFNISVVDDPGATDRDIDFTIPSTLTFDAGLTQGQQTCENLTAIDDTILEFDSQILLSLSAQSNPPGATLADISPANTNVTFSDDEAQTEIAIEGSLSRMVQETNQTNHTVCISFNPSITSLEVSLQVDFGSTAPSLTDIDVDYSFPGGQQVTVPIGNFTEACLDVMIIDDAVYELGNLHGFVVDLQSTTPLLSISSTDDAVSFSILDPEDAEFEFSMSSYTVVEGEMVNFTLTTDSGFDTSVNVFVEMLPGGTGSPEAGDFFSTLMATFGPGDTMQNILVTAANTMSIDGQETLNFGIVTNDAYTVGPINTTVLFIEDENGGTFNFVTTPLSGMEGEDVTVTATLTFSTGTVGIALQPVTVDLMILDVSDGGGNTADAQTDLTVGSLTLTINTCDPCPGGALTTTVDITLDSDTVLEGTETFMVAFNESSISPQAMFSFGSPATVIITEATPTVALNESSYTIFESVHTSEATGLPVCAVIVGIDEIQVSLADNNVNLLIDGGQTRTYTFNSSSGPVVCDSLFGIDDSDFEGQINRNLTLDASSAVDLIASADVVPLIILDPEDAELSLTSDNPTVTEGSLFPLALNFTTDGIRVGGDYEVTLEATNMTANSGDDFSAPFSIIIANNSGPALFPEPIITVDDDILEYDEQFSVSIPLSDEYTLGTPSSLTFTILDGDAGDFVVGLSIAPSPTVDEGGGPIMVDVTLSRTDGMEVNLVRNVTVDLALMNGTAVANADFIHEPMPQVVFGPCMPCMMADLEQMIPITIVNDNNLEFFHNFSVAIMNIDPSGVGQNGSPLALGISDDEPDVVTIEFAQTSFTCEEGTTCTVSGSLVGLTGQIQTDFDIGIIVDDTIDPATDSGTDFTAPPSQPISFSTFGSPMFSFDITILDDDDFEGSHSFSITFNDTYNAIKGGTNASTTIVILDPEDAVLSLSSTTLSIPEGMSMFPVLVEFMTNGTRVNGDFEVTLETTDITANSGDDFSAQSSISITVGSGPASFAANINTVADDILEYDEQFSVSIPLSDEYTLGSPSSLTFTIVDGDAGDFVVGLSFAATPTVDEEGGPITVDVTLSRTDGMEVNLARNVTVDLALMNGTAGATADFTHAPMPQVVFGPCTACMGTDLERMIPINIVNDTHLEFFHNFSVAIMSIDPSGVGQTGSPLALGISDDEPDVVTIEFARASFTCEEGTTCTVSGSLVGLTGQIQTDFDIGIIVNDTIDSLTDSGTDFTVLPSRPISFTALGSLMFSFNITIQNDNDFEGDHSFSIMFDDANNAIMGGANSSTTIVITDLDDATVSLSNSTATLDEGFDGTNVICIEVTSLRGSILRDIQVSLQIENLMAVYPEDFMIHNLGDLQDTSFATTSSEGSTICANLSIVADDILEATQSFRAVLSSDNAFVDNDITVVSINDLNTAAFEFEFEGLTVKEGVNDSALPRLRIVSVPNGGVQGIIEVDLTVFSSGATVIVDYEIVDMIVTFGSEDHSTIAKDTIDGTLTSPANITIIDDEILEEMEDVDLLFIGNLPGSKSSTTDTLAVTICDDEEATVVFNPTEYTALEGNGTLEVCVQILTDAESSQENVIVTLGSVDGPKTILNQDYDLPIDLTVTFSAGDIDEVIECFDPIDIEDDDVFESDQQEFTVEVSSVEFPSGPADNLNGAGNNATVAIQDNEEDFVTVSINTTGSPLSAMEGESVQVCVYISQEPAGGRECPLNVTLSYSPYGDKPASSDDIVFTERELEIAVDMNQTYFTIVFVNDFAVEGTQAFSVMISDTSPSANFNTSDQLVIEIEDDDAIEVSFADSSPINVTESDGVYATICLDVVLPAGGVECPFDIILTPEPIDALLDEDYSDFEVAVPVLMTAATGTPVCASNARLGVLDDDILEPDQSFQLTISEATIESAIEPSNSTREVVIMEDNDVLKLQLADREYLVTENQTISVCIGTFGIIQRSVNISFSVESLTNILRGEARVVQDLFDFELGTAATFNNTLMDPSDCVDYIAPYDGLKEGITLSMLRIDTNDSGVCLGRDQTLLIEQGNGVVTAKLTAIGQSVNESDGSVEICVMLSAIPIQDIVTISVSTSSLTAQENEDYKPVNTVLEWHQDSELTQCVYIPILNDECVEEKEELFIVSISTEEECVVLGANIETNITIQDDDRLLLDFRQPFVQVEEPSGNATLCVYICDGELKRNASFLFHVVNGSAYSPTDFTVDVPYYELTFTEDTAGKDLCVTIDIVDDDIYEDMEFFGVMLTSDDSCVEFKRNQSSIGILDDDCAYLNLTSESIVVSEAAGVVEVCVVLTASVSAPVSAMLFTVPGDATDVVDFSLDGAMSLLLFTEAGEQCVNISIAMDNLLEDTELFSVILGSRDDRVKLINRVTRVYILNSGTVTFGFTQTLYSVPEEDSQGNGYVVEVCVQLTSGELDREVVITLGDQDGSAIAGEDYEEIMEVVTTMDFVFQAEAAPMGRRRKRNGSPVEQCTNVSIIADELVEYDEYFRLYLTTEDPAVVLIPDNATVEIINNDYANVSLELDSYDVAESDGNVTVCAILIGGELARAVAVNFSTSDTVATATADVDYTSITDYVLNFPADSPINTPSCVSVEIIEDTAVEYTERFDVELMLIGDPVNIPESANASAAVFISDVDELGVGLAVQSDVVNETESYLRVKVVILEGSLEINQSVLVYTQAGTATPGSDYEELSTMLSLSSGLMMGDFVYVNVSIINDMVVEEMFENFTVNLNDTSRVVVTGYSSSDIDIREDLTDTVNVTFDQSMLSLNEGDNGSVCVNITGELEREVSVSVSLVNGTAIGSGVDHTFPDSTPITFNSSPDSYCFTFSTIQDEIYELDELFTTHLDSFDPQIVIHPIMYLIVTIFDDDKVEFQFTASESVCEGAGYAMVCVQLLTDIEREATATVETSSLTAQSPDDYWSDTLSFTFPNPSSANTQLCSNVSIVDDNVTEPCEDFSLSLSSIEPRSCLVGDNVTSVIIYDDEDISEFLLFNDSPQIVGASLGLDYNISGCARVFCQVRGRTARIDCSPAIGSITGDWFVQSVTGSRLIQRLQLTIEPFCPNQTAPVFEDRRFRTDNIQCSVVYTDQQYEFDPVSGNVTVEWAGTGPTATVNVDEFTCIIDGSSARPCSSPYILEGLATNATHTFSVAPQQRPSSPLCQRLIRRPITFFLP